MLAKKVPGWSKIEPAKKHAAIAAVREGTSDGARALRAEAERIMAAKANVGGIDLTELGL